MHQMHRIFTVIALCLLSTAIFALPNDARLKLTITADTTHYSHRTGITTFNGHVIATQGSMKILADRLITKSNQQNKIEEATAFGLQQPAQFFSTRTNNSELRAKARIIQFHPAGPEITLKRNAEIIQGDNSFHGEHIIYDRLNDVVQVPETSRGKAVIIYDMDKTTQS